MSKEKQTVLITGASSGIGKAAAKFFAEKGWNVVATMRTPEKEKELGKLANVLLTRLDVTDEASIEQAMNEGIAKFGRIDALVNNAGYGLSGPLESTSMDQIRRQFETNVFGLMAVSKAILPHFRKNGGGHLVQVASMGGRLTFPLYSIYHGTKWAVEGFSESLQYELRPFNIRVKIIEPGAIKTDFYDRSADKSTVETPVMKDYAGFVKSAAAIMDEAGAKGAPAELVAKTIFKAATDKSWKLRYPVGTDAKSLMMLRGLLVSDRLYMNVVRSQIMK